jgi:hypothetical protein
MEIGTSSMQLFDIGLNVAGFISAGALMILIRSFFTGRKEKLAPAAEDAPAIKINTDSAAKRPGSDNDPVEYIDLKGIDWNHNKYSDPIRPVEDRNSPNRRRAINLAKKMLSNTRNIQKRTLPDADRPLSAGKAEVIRKGAGR